MKTNTPLADALFLRIEINTLVRAKNDIVSAFSKWCETVIQSSGRRLSGACLPFTQTWLTDEVMQAQKS